MPDKYLALTPESLPERLYKNKRNCRESGNKSIRDVTEAGDGNLNLVFIVTGDLGKVIVNRLYHMFVWWVTVGR